MIGAAKTEYQGLRQYIFARAKIEISFSNISLNKAGDFIIFIKYGTIILHVIFFTS